VTDLSNSRLNVTGNYFYGINKKEILKVYKFFSESKPVPIINNGAPSTMNSQANVVKGGNVVTGGTLILCFCFSTFLTMLAKQTIPVVSQQSTFYTFS
jgi:hypothetical protein